MGHFVPLSRERAEQIRKILKDSQGEGQSLIFDDEGRLEGASPFQPSADDNRNSAGRYKVHY